MGGRWPWPRRPGLRSCGRSQRKYTQICSNCLRLLKLAGISGAVLCMDGLKTCMDCKIPSSPPRSCCRAVALRLFRSRDCCAACGPFPEPFLRSRQGVPPFQAGSFPFAEAVFPFLEAFAPVTLGRMQGGIGADARLHSAGFHLASGQISLTRLLPHTGNRLSATALMAAVTARQQARNASSVPIQCAFVPKLS